MTDKLKNLENKLSQYRAAEDARNPSPQAIADAQNRNVGMRAGMEMVVSILAGAGIGLGIDGWLNSAPFGLIIFFLLGCGAAFMSVYRLTQNADSAVGFASLQKEKEIAIKPPESDS